MKYLQMNSLQRKNTLINKNILFVVFIAFSSFLFGTEMNNSKTVSVLNIQLAECGSDVSVVGENIAELTGSSITYQIRIENTGNSINTYTVYADNYSATGENPDGSSLENNIDFTQELLDLNLNPINGVITLNPGETIDLVVKLTSQIRNQYDKWNCTEIIAINNTCPENEGRTVVFTYVPVPEGVIIGYNNYIQHLNTLTALITEDILLA